MSVFNVFRRSAYRLTLMAAISTSLMACSGLGGSSGRVAGLITPYKVEIVQGNFVSKEQKEALQRGMQRAQVRDILGSPLVASAFHADRWEYVFTIRRQGTEPQQRKLAVFFKGDELAKVESDELISEQEFVNSLSAGRSLGKVPVLEATVPAAAKTPESSTPQTTTTSPTPAAPAVYPPLEPIVR